jgi:hypothetical protein
MVLAETVQQIAKSKQALYSFVLWQFAQAADNGGSMAEAYSNIFLSSAAVIDVSFLPRFKRR